jgi:hypothetical protein
MPNIGKRTTQRDIKNKEQWYEHIPKSLETSQEGKVTILWN